MASTTSSPLGLPASPSWKDVLEELLPPQGTWTEEEYLTLTDHRNRPVEYSHGLLELLPMPTDKHQAIVEFLYRALFAFIDPRGGKVRISPLRLHIAPGKFREPDLLLLRSASDPRRKNRFWDGVDLVVEVVSEEKPERDLVDKRVDYAQARIPEYWIIDPRTQSISVLRLAGDRYDEADLYHRGNKATSVLLPDFWVDVASVLDAD